MRRKKGIERQKRVEEGIEEGENGNREYSGRHTPSTDRHTPETRFENSYLEMRSSGVYLHSSFHIEEKERKGRTGWGIYDGMMK